MKSPFLRRGFSMLEAIVVIAIVGILAAVAVYSLSITRASNRDAKRISDVSVIHAAMTQFWLQKASYPPSDAVDLGKAGTNTDKLTIGGFVASSEPSQPVFLERVPVGPKANEYYRYHASSQGYSLRFTTEQSTAYGPAGTYYLHTDGVDKQDVEK